MSGKPINCPSCGHSVNVPPNQDIVECSYCKSFVKVREQLNIKVKQTADLDHLYELCIAAFDGQHYQESYDYATKILEYDSSDLEAWKLKGMSAACLSTLNDSRIVEAIHDFRQGISLGNNLNDEVVFEMADFLNDISMSSLYKMKENFSNLHEEDINNNFFNISSGLDTAHTLKPNDMSILKNAIEANNIRMNLVNSAAGKILQEENEKYASIIKKNEPNYSKPAPDSCFVVTATMGDINHPRVIIMRRFRDDILLNFEFGNAFIRWYYKHGPSIADFIADKGLLKKISYFFIVFPASEIAKTLLRRKK